MAARNRRELRLVPLQGGEGEGGGGGQQNDALRAAGGRGHRPGDAPREKMLGHPPPARRAVASRSLRLEAGPARREVKQMRASLPAHPCASPPVWRGGQTSGGAPGNGELGWSRLLLYSWSWEPRGGGKCTGEAEGLMRGAVDGMRPVPCPAPPWTWLCRSASRTPSAAARGAARPHHPAPTPFLPASRHDMLPV